MHHPKDGIMSVVLGLISFISLIVVLVFSYKNNGATSQNGLSAMLATVFAFIGLLLGIISECHRDVYRFFPNTGIVLNVLSLGIGVFMLYLGGLF